MPTTKTERKLRDRVHRIAKLMPGRHRIYSLERITSFLEADIDLGSVEDTEGAREDVLFLKRLAYDLHEIRNSIKGDMSGESRPPRP